eukprot:6228613-Prymnesium_polylepis.4
MAFLEDHCPLKRDLSALGSDDLARGIVQHIAQAGCDAAGAESVKRRWTDDCESCLLEDGLLCGVHRSRV